MRNVVSLFDVALVPRFRGYHIGGKMYYKRKRFGYARRRAYGYRRRSYGGYRRRRW